MNTLTIGIYGNSHIECQSLFQILTNIESARDVQFNISIHDSYCILLKNCSVFDMIFLFIDSITPETEHIINSFKKSEFSTHLVLISQSDSIFSLGYKFKVDNCWKKPVLYENVEKEIDSLLKLEFLLLEPYKLHFSQKGIRKLYYRKLRYIETGNRQLIFHYNGEVISYFGHLTDLESKLPFKTFFRCNNSYLVNIMYIEEIIPDMHRYKIRLITGEELPLSRNKKNELVKLIVNAQ